MWDWLDDWGDFETPDFSPLPEYIPPEIELQEIPNFEDDWYERIFQGGDSDGSSTWDWLKGLGGAGGFAGGSSGSSGSSGGIADIIKFLTGGKGGGSLTDWLPLLGGLGAIGAGINTNNKTEDATKEIKAATEKANQLATDLIGGARNNFAPYMQAGQSAIPQLQALVGQGLASKFSSPIAGLTAQPGMQKQAPSGISGAMTLAQLAKRVK